MTKGVKRKILLSIGVLIVIIILLLVFTDIYKVVLPIFDIGITIDENFGDVILVLGGGLRRGLKIGFSTEERILLAVKLYKERKRKIIISDGSLYQGSRAIKIYKDFMINRGVSNSDIIIEGRSQTTYQNFIYTCDLIKGCGADRVIICTSPYHQKRAEMIIRNLNIYEFRIAKMTESEIYKSKSILRRLRNIKLILREIGAVIKYRIFFKK
jgi:uncharacterized SAM-binding protein YcdF (DUF218 family)